MVALLDRIAAGSVAGTVLGDAFGVSRAAIWKAMETTLATIEEDDDMFPQVSGGRYVYDPSEPPGQRLKAFFINGQPLQFMKVYGVTTNEFVVAMLEFLEIPYTNLAVKSYSEFEVLQEWVVRLGKLTGEYSPRRILAQ